MSEAFLFFVAIVLMTRDMSCKQVGAERCGLR